MIFIFSISDSLGGAEQILFKMAKFYSEQKNEIVKVCFFKPKSNEYWTENLNSNVEVFYCNNSLITVVKCIKQYRFSRVFSSHLMINSFLGICRTVGVLKTKRLIVRESTSVFGRYSGIKLLRYKVAYWLGYRKLDLLICQTQRMSDELKENVSFLFNRTKVKVIPNPFEFPNQSLIDEEVSIPENTIVSAGRLIPEKGFDVLIKSFAKVIKHNPELNLMILGEGNERSKLEKLILELNLDKKVILKGYVKNVYPYFKKAKVCVVSSIREGFPNVLLQMMSQNERVISTDCAGGINKIEGIHLAETNNVESLYLAIKDGLIFLSCKKKSFSFELNRRSVGNFVKEVEIFLN